MKKLKTAFLRYKQPRLVLCTVFACATLFLSAQNSQTPITPVSPVAVPSVQPVTASSSFNSPSLPNFPAAPQPQAPAAQQTKSDIEPKTQNNAKEIKNSGNTPPITAASLHGLASSLLAGGQNNNLMTALLGNAGINSETNSGVSSVLEQLLVKLEQIQETLRDSALSAPASDTHRQPAFSPAKANGQILRFTVNNYSVLDTCRTVFFSQRGKDGDFLLTGDRKYLSDGKTRVETFYLFFKKTGLTDYEVACSVSQDYENQYSFLYQLAQRTGITARQTGNFITVRVDEPGWKLDFLADVSDQELF